MKEALPTSQLRSNPRRFFTSKSKNKLAKTTACLILVILSYTLGYLSAQSPPTSQSTSLADHTLKTAKRIFPQKEIASGANRAGTENDHNLFGTKCADTVPPELVPRTILDRVFDGRSPWENFPPEGVGAYLKPKKIKGWGSRGAVFENLIRKAQPKIIVEVGTFLGASALHMAELSREMGLRSQILRIDDFRGWPGFREAFKDIQIVNGDVMLMYQFMQNVVSANATGSVMFMPFSSGSALEKLCQWGVSGDLIEVDAGHDFHSAWTDINRAYKILRAGGVIFGHDYFTSADNKGVRRAVNLFARLNNLRIQVDGQHWLIQSPPPLAQSGNELTV